jgi:hypothetical protein
MAFRASNHKVLDWTRYDNSGTLIKVVRTFNSENLVADEYKSLTGSKAGDPSLYITYVYDARGNILAENKEIREWTATQETAYNSASETDIDSAADEVAALTKTQYSTDTANVQYWLGLEADGQLTKTHIGTATSTKQIFHYALPTTAAGEECLQRIHHIDSSVIVSKIDVLGTWSSAMETLAIPAISDITLSAAVTVEDQAVGEDIGTLAGAGSNPGHGTITWTLTSTTLSGDKLRIDGDKLEVGPNQIGSADAGTYNAVIKGTDELGGSREETFTITVTSNDITDIALSAASINYGDAADTAIGTLSFTGGVGTVTPTITSNGGMTNLRLDGNVLEAGPSFMNTAAGTYTVRITVTDQASTPQTYYEDFTITVVSTAITDIALSALIIYDDSLEGADIGNLTCSGGVGDVDYTITSNGGLDNLKITDTGTSTGLLEVDTGGIVDAVGTYTVRITANDEASQTYYEDFDIEVAVSFTNTKFLNFDTQTSNEYIDLGGKTDFDDSDDFFFRRTNDDYTISWWMRLPESTAVYTDGSSTDHKHIFSSFDGSFTNGIAGYFDGSDFVFFIAKDDSNYGEFKVASVTGWQDNTWAHYAITYDASAKVAAGEGSSTGIVIYKDEVSQAIVAGDTGTWLDSDYEADNTTKNFRFGYPDYTEDDWTNPIMAINDIAIWKSALSSGDISTIYNSGTPITVEGIDDSNLKRCYRFEDGDGTDSAGNYTATIGSAATVLEHYENTKYLACPATDFNNRLETSNITTSTPIIRSDKSWTVSFWYKGTDTVGAFCGNDIWFRVLQYSGRLTLFPANTSYGGYNELIDGNWHHVVLTFLEAETTSTTWDCDAHSTDESTSGLSCYIDGVHKPRVSGATTSSVSLNNITHPWRWISASNWHSQQGDYDGLAIFNEHKTGAAILGMYNEGHGTNLSNDSSCIVFINVGSSDSNGAQDDSVVLTNNGNDPSNTYVTTVVDGTNADTIVVTEY